MRRSPVVAAVSAAFPLVLFAAPASAEPLQLVPTAIELAPSLPILASTPTPPRFLWHPKDNLGMCVSFSNGLTPGVPYSLVLTATGANSQVIGASSAIVQTAYGYGPTPTACVPGGVFGGFGGAVYTATAAAVVVFPPSAPTFAEQNECTQTTVRTVCVR